MKQLNRIRDSVREQCEQFTFDAHAHDLISFFRETIERAGENKTPVEI